MAGIAPFDRPRRPPAMTRCECAEMPFDEIARRMKQESLSLEQIADRTGCGRLCTACLPDLRAHVSRDR